VNSKLTVNDFSKIAGVSPRNLRYYDSIGLFKASGLSENGYRFYTIDKVEEIHLINYFRHMGVSIKEIKKHLENRHIDQYETILEEQLKRVHKEMSELKLLEKRIQKRISSIEYIRTLPPTGEINIQKLGKRRILKLEKEIREQQDWEFSLIKLQKDHSLPPSIFIGDIGFIINMDTVKTRGPEEFSALFLMADDPFYDNTKNLEWLDAGIWLTTYTRGDHHEARKHYDSLLEYTRKNNINLGNFAIERTIIDHYISSDPNFYITEIQIPIIE
jgi:DNA-binding transcriptional MerR regulator